MEKVLLLLQSGYRYDAVALGLWAHLCALFKEHGSCVELSYATVCKDLSVPLHVVRRYMDVFASLKLISTLNRGKKGHQITLEGGACTMDGAGMSGGKPAPSPMDTKAPGHVPRKQTPVKSSPVQQSIESTPQTPFIPQGGDEQLLLSNPTGLTKGQLRHLRKLQREAEEAALKEQRRKEREEKRLQREAAEAAKKDERQREREQAKQEKQRALAEAKAKLKAEKEAAEKAANVDILPPNGQYYRIARQYQELMQKKHGSGAPAVTEKFLCACARRLRNLVVKHKYALEDICKVLTWTARHEFWGPVCVSLDTMEVFSTKDYCIRFEQLYRRWHQESPTYIQPRQSAEQKLYCQLLATYPQSVLPTDKSPMDLMERMLAFDTALREHGVENGKMEANARDAMEKMINRCRKYQGE